ncbi:MAG: hypothetical protein RR420_00760 [Anaerovoracaceae bacterium]
MAYLEPGAYAKVIEQLPASVGSAPAMTPLVMGSALTKLQTTELMTRGATGDIDALPRKAVSIVKVGLSKDQSDFVDTTDYVLSADKLSVEWKTASSKKPVAGTKYFVTFIYEVDDTYYSPKLIYSADDIKKYIGNDIKLQSDGGGGINRLAVGAQIMIDMGVSPVIALPVKPNEQGQVNAVQYTAAINTFVNFMDNAWRIVPMDWDDDINAAVLNHVIAMEDFLERKERCAIFNKKHEAFVDFETLLTQFGGYTSALKNSKIISVYPDKATKLLSDGNYYTLDAPFVCCSVAALQASKSVEQSMTRSQINVFNTLLGLPMLRKQLNAVAEKGVTLLEQKQGAGTPVVVRHALTTNMLNAQTCEPSVQAVEDYTKKFIRNIADNYIGKYNITPDLITKINGAITSGLLTLQESGIILGGRIVSLAQDKNNPDTLILVVEVKVPYPCNKIMITILAS